MSIRSGDSHRNDLDEGSWIYLASSADRAGNDLRLQLVEACEASGWPVISWARSFGVDAGPPSLEHEIETVSHAVAHADVVVVLVDGHSGISEPEPEPELELAKEHRRPVVVLCPSGQADSLRGYDRARLISYEDAEQCGVELRSVLVDPGFGATIVEAAAEPSSYV